MTDGGAAPMAIGVTVEDGLVLRLELDNGTAQRIRVSDVLGPNFVEGHLNGLPLGDVSVGHDGMYLIWPNGVEVPIDALTIESDSYIAMRALANRPDEQASIGTWMQYVLLEYPRAREETFAHHPFARLLRRDLPNLIRDRWELDVLSVRGSAGITRWAEVPWISFESAPTEFAVRYLFRPDSASLYLSLSRNLGSRATLSAGVRDALRAEAAASVRSLDLVPPEMSGMIIGDIDLAARGARAKACEVGNILAVEYWFGDFPDENTLRTDAQRLVGFQKRLLA